MFIINVCIESLLFGSKVKALSKKVIVTPKLFKEEIIEFKSTILLASRSIFVTKTLSPVFTIDSSSSNSFLPSFFVPVYFSLKIFSAPACSSF